MTPYRSYVFSGTALVDMPGCTKPARVVFGPQRVRAGAKLREMAEAILNALLEQTGGVAARLNAKDSMIEVRHLWAPLHRPSLGDIEIDVRKVFLLVDFHCLIDLMEHYFKGEPYVWYR